MRELRVGLMLTAHRQSYSFLHRNLRHVGLRFQNYSFYVACCKVVIVLCTSLLYIEMPYNISQSGHSVHICGNFL